MALLQRIPAQAWWVMLDYVVIDDWHGDGLERINEDKEGESVIQVAGIVNPAAAVQADVFPPAV
ncbi:MAG TPA: hypothetical protein VNI77_05485 [Nitrososphaera sp.]|nr:hypothetical protein [Nitrososphaera sp.]